MFLRAPLVRGAENGSKVLGLSLGVRVLRVNMLVLLPKVDCAVVGTSCAYRGCAWPWSTAEEDGRGVVGQGEGKDMDAVPTIAAVDVALGVLCRAEAVEVEA